MLFTLTEELLIFLYAVAVGAVIFAMYDLVSVCTQKSGCPIVVCNIADGVCIVVACAVMLFVSISVSRGIVRFFEFVGVMLGAVLYKALLSTFFCAVFHKITDFFCAFFKLFFKILLTPLIFMYKIMIKCINGLLCPIRWVAKKLCGSIARKVEKGFHKVRKARNKT